MFLYWIDKERFGGGSQPHLSDLPFLHVPIPDFGVPTKSDFDSIRVFFEKYQDEKPGIPILVHCTAGNGRTGTILASLIKILDNIKSSVAIQRVREVNPLAIETDKQEAFIDEL